MVQGDKCPNLNHSRSNVPVRFCPTCGEVVNADIPIRECKEDEHAIRRRERSMYCWICGKQLKEGR